MRLYHSEEHPLRVYLEEETKGELNKLVLSLNTKYSPPESDYDNDDELDSIILSDEDSKVFIVHGLLQVIIKEAMSLGIECHSDSSLEEPADEYPDIPPDILEGISLRPYQIEGISAAIAHRRGIIQVCTGGGKTEMLTSVTRYLLDHSDMHVLVCVPTTNLLYQTYDRMVSRGIDERDISLLGDGNTIDPTKRVLISTTQSAFKRLDNDEIYMRWLSQVDCLMLDEAHHSKCRTWSTLIDRVAPKYLLGFSAEPFHRDKDHIISDLILRGLLGPVIHRVTLDDMISLGYLSKPYVLAVDTSCKGNIYNVLDWRIVNKQGIVGNSLRNEAIRDIASKLISRDKRPLILVQQISHGAEIARQLSSLGYTVYMMQGGRKISVYLQGINIENYVDNDNLVLRDFNDNKIDALIGTSTLDEGADIPSLSSVILAGGGKGRLKTIQRIGRAMRKKDGLNCTFIIDFRDRFNVVTQSHFKKRKALYDEMNIGVYYPTGDIDTFIDALELERSNELKRSENEKV